MWFVLSCQGKHKSRPQSLCYAKLEQVHVVGTDAKSFETARSNLPEVRDHIISAVENYNMGKYDAVEVQGAERDEVLSAIQKQLAVWGLTMPPVTPLPLHFGLHKFMEIGETEYWVANESEHGYCGKFLFVFDGQTCPYHHHNLKHETFFVVKGTLRMKVAEEERLMHEGDLLAMPPGVGHSFTGVGPCLILEVSMPSILQDNFFTDKRIGQDGVI